MKIWLWGTLGSVLLLAGLAASFVGFVQPGLTCPDDDASAGCPATPFYSGMLGIGLLLLCIASIFFVLFVRAGQARNRVTG